MTRAPSTTLPPSVAQVLSAANEGEVSQEDVGAALAQVAVEDGPPVIVRTANATVAKMARTLS